MFSAKYIFLDVVSFTKNRSIEAQSDIVSALNSLVKTSISEQGILENKVIYIPTGDGICIALIDIEAPFDIHLQSALRILENIKKHNDVTENVKRKFQVRIGLNANIDNLIIDINDRLNVAGAGISMAARIMDMADGNQILIGPAVYETLRYREKYESAFKSFYKTVKHGVGVTVYQFVKEGFTGLNIDTPEAFKGSVYTEPQLSRFAAHYFAHAIKQRPFFLKRISLSDAFPSAIILWLLSLDSVAKSEATGEVDRTYYETHKARNLDLEVEFDYFNSFISLFNKHWWNI